VLTLHVTESVAGKPRRNDVQGAFGYSTHTDYDVFWIAAHHATCTFGEAGCRLENEVFAIYAAHL
jgi:hypothetical protein